MSWMAFVMAWPMRSSLRTCAMRSAARSSSASGQQVLEYAAGVGEADDDDVAGFGISSLNSTPMNAQFHLTLGRAVDLRVAARLENPENTVVPAFPGCRGRRVGRGPLRGCRPRASRYVRSRIGASPCSPAAMSANVGSSRLSPVGVPSIRTRFFKSVSMRFSSADPSTRAGDGVFERLDGYVHENFRRRRRSGAG